MIIYSVKEQLCIWSENELRWNQPTNLPMFSYCCPLSGWGFSCGETEIFHSMFRETGCIVSSCTNNLMYKKDVLFCWQIIILLKRALIQLGFDQCLITLDILLNWCIPKENRWSFSYHLFSFFFSWGNFDVYHALEKVLSMITFWCHTAAIFMQSA